MRGRPGTLLVRQFLAGEQLKGPKVVLTVMVLPAVEYFRQSLPSKQNAWLGQSIEKLLESSSKAQPVFERDVRVSASSPPLTTHVSLVLLQMGQAGA